MKKLFLFSFLIVSFSTFAGTKLASQTIVGVSMGWTGEGIYITTTEKLNAEGCSTGTAVMLTETPLFEENLSVLLSAFHANSKVRLYVDGCAGQHMKLKAVAIEK
ncbi:hypothetical protein tinsulaeT_35690 [Thalassotalea insulae]|uniref:Uncharacterized protein n=1 Tax=Thalassotalea insulae TaxID=2056778 RepID=A0ABQ6GYC6_9GAMM|nr:hypothetical protein [Thalassotalea insulae]GLX80229.1 hypothetical protein tinsulaeT_35690 [Thalassotalea insulae]